MRKITLMSQVSLDGSYECPERQIDRHRVAARPGPRRGGERHPSDAPLQPANLTAAHKPAVPDVEWHLSLRQTFLLAGPRPLELTFHTNAVGSEIFLRDADRRHTVWKDKPPALRAVAAHHEVGRRDFTEDARRWIGGLDALGSGAQGAGGS
ncbi:hypothetical protein [Streptomyces sp. AP-93]|uniref:hypothetical protein n=1 Tax=Streptomyces sp. AP-93 TaxID=2929048 RepID=UPI001FB04511|nr:hypothetical protein [Streptomyces sp. AP-93]MCJ0874229.1 hypothetical protein [Streptomyces sp. AP-93]